MKHETTDNPTNGDASLVQRALTGELQAFDALVLRYRQIVFRQAFHGAA